MRRRAGCLRGPDQAPESSGLHQRAGFIGMRSEVQVVKGASDAGDVPQAHMGVSDRGHYAVVAQQLFDEADVRPGLQQVGRVAVAEGVYAAGLGDAGDLAFGPKLQS